MKYKKYEAKSKVKQFNPKRKKWNIIITQSNKIFGFIQKMLFDFIRLIYSSTFVIIEKMLFKFVHGLIIIKIIEKKVWWFKLDHGRIEPWPLLDSHSQLQPTQEPDAWPPKKQQRPLCV